jgi:replicative DNA helicase
MSDEQALPHSLEAERSVLGAILVSPDLMNQAVGGLKPDDFYRSAHRHIYRAMLDRFERGIAIDMVTVKEKLETDGLLGESGGLEFLAALADGVPRLAHLGAYLDIVRDKSLQRNLYSAGQEISRAALTGDETSEQLLGEAEKRVFEAGGAHLTRDYKSLEEVGKTMEPMLERIRSNLPIAGGVRTGFAEMDEMTTGMHPGNLWVVAARPGVGKTSFALSVARNVVGDGKGVLVFSLEMTSEEIYMRLLCGEADLDIKKFRHSQLNHEEKARMLEAKAQLDELPLYIDDGAGTTHPLMRAKARRLAKEKQLDLVIVDYLQIMGSTSRRVENRAVEIAEMSKGLKELAKDLRIPVMALSQLNRASEKRGENEPPLLSDLRESGAIEQDADLVAFLQRNLRADLPAERNLTDLFIAKQRNGPVGRFKLTFLDNRAQFVDAAPFEVDSY